MGEHHAVALILGSTLSIMNTACKRGYHGGKGFFAANPPVPRSIIRRATTMCFLGNAHELLGYLAREMD
jgi:hypothetical protein